MADNNPFRSLQEGLAQFNAGAKELQLQRALDAANQRVNEIKTVETNERKQRAGLQQVANDLVFQMSGLGASASSIQQLTGAIAPQEKTFQSAEQMLLNAETPEQEARAKSVMDFQTQQDIRKSDASLNRAMTLQDRKEEATNFQMAKSELNKVKKEHNTSYKALVKSTQEARNAIRLLDSGSPMTSSAIGTMLARASGEVGPLTEQERAIFEGARDAFSRVKRATSINAFSQLPETDKKALRDLAELYANSGDELISNISDKLTNQYEASYGDYEGKIFKNRDDLSFQITGLKPNPKKASGSWEAPSIPGLTPKAR